ncbi:hypothetical protein C8R43DRAFT_979534 [Mycena crocata]|nr:hypothetical protein C8R43DRAFT_979534 [Mycena crocata]
MPGKHVHFSSDVEYPETPSPAYSYASLPSSSGPRTPPNPYLPLHAGPGITTNPALAATKHTSIPLYFDVTIPTQNITCLLSNISRKQLLCEPATAPTLPSMVITHPLVPHWQISVKPSEGVRYVRVCDVLEAIYTSLRLQATGADFSRLTPHQQNTVTAAFTRRWMKIPDRTGQTIEQAKGLKRVDFLGNAIYFAGLMQSPQNGPNHWTLCVQ